MTDASEPAPDRPRGPAVVIAGASAGGVEALVALVSSLPARLPARRCSSCCTSRRPGRACCPRSWRGRARCPSCAPADGEQLRAGHVYVAPPDCHLVVEDSRLRLSQAPRENGHRPAIDPTMRTAAHAYDRATIGIVLSGSRDDGTAGLMAIKASRRHRHRAGPRRGAVPGDAAAAPSRTSSPTRSCRSRRWRAGSSSTTPRTESGTHEQQLAHRAPTPEHVDDARIWRSRHRGRPAGSGDGRGTRFTCPDCGGVLFERHEGLLERFAVQRRARLLDREPVERAGRGARERAVGRRPRARGPRRDLLRRLGRRRPGPRDSCARRSRSSARPREALERARTIRDAIQSSSDDRAIAAES